jgi:hypothetical protein
MFRIWPVPAAAIVGFYDASECGGVSKDFHPMMRFSGEVGSAAVNRCMACWSLKVGRHWVNALSRSRNA